MRHRFLQRYDWVSGFAKCENTTVQDQAVWRAWGYTTAELHCFISEVGGSAATLLWLIFCTHSSMEERQVEGKCRSWSGRFGSFFCRWEEHKVKDKSVCVCVCICDGVKRVDSVMVRYSCDRYQERKQLFKKETHFRNRGKNWAPVPDLCKLKLSIGSPCYDTCWGKKKIKRSKSIHEKKNAAVKWEGGDTLLYLCHLTPVLLHCSGVCMNSAVPQRCPPTPEFSLDTPPSMCVSCAHAVNKPDVKQKKKESLQK